MINALNQIARNQGFSRASVLQIMNLFKLLDKMQDFLAGLNDSKQIKKYFERSFASDDEFHNDCNSEKHGAF